MKKLMMAGAAAALLGASVLPAFAQSPTAAPGNTGAPAVSGKPLKQVNLACVQAAVDKRETAVQGAFAAFSGAVTGALSARASALHAAWGGTDKAQVKKGVKAAWEAYRTALKAARKAYNSSVKTAWTQFRTDRKGCGPNAGVEEDAGQGAELAL